MSLDQPLAQAPKLSEKARIIRDQVPTNAVIAHRGVPYFAPEETSPSFLLARDLGADYLEADLQRTKDGVIVAFHDDDLRRTTNVAEVFPNKAGEPISAFTWEELQKLDAGSWFNKNYPLQARSSYENLKILSLDQLIDIAEGGEHQPGLYLETKEAEMYPGIEKDIYEILQERGWTEKNPRQKPEDFEEGKVAVGYSKGRVVMQTFAKSSLVELNKHFKDTPLAFLLWKDDMEDNSVETFEKWVDFGLQNGAQFIGTSIPSPPNHYPDLMHDWMVEMIHDKGLYIHPYTFVTSQSFEQFCPKSEGQFTDRSDLLLDYYGRPRPEVEGILVKHGY